MRLPASNRQDAADRQTRPRLLLDISQSYPVNRGVIGAATVWYNVVHSADLKEGRGGGGLLHYNTGAAMVQLSDVAAEDGKSPKYGFDATCVTKMTEAEVAHIRYGNDNSFPWLYLCSEYKDAARDVRPWVLHEGEQVPDWTGYGPLEAAELAAKLNAELTIVLPVYEYNHTISQSWWTQSQRNDATIMGVEVAKNYVRYLLEPSPVPDGTTPSAYGTAKSWTLPAFSNTPIQGFTEWVDIDDYQVGDPVYTTYRGRKLGWRCIQETTGQDPSDTAPPYTDNNSTVKGTTWTEYWAHVPDYSNADEEHAFDMYSSDLPPGYWGWVRHSHTHSPDPIPLRSLELGNELYWQISPDTYKTYVMAVSEEIRRHSRDVRIVVSVGHPGWDTGANMAWNNALETISGYFDEVTLQGYYGPLEVGYLTGDHYISLADYKFLLAKSLDDKSSWAWHGAGATWDFEHRFKGRKPLHCYEYSTQYGTNPPSGYSSIPAYYPHQHRWKSALALGVFLADMANSPDVAVANYYTIGRFRQYNAGTSVFALIENDMISGGEPGAYRTNAEYEVLKRFGLYLKGKLIPCQVTGNDYLRATAAYDAGRARVFLINTDPRNAHTLELTGMTFGAGKRYTLSCAAGMEGTTVAAADANVTYNAETVELTLSPATVTILDVTA